MKKITLFLMTMVLAMVGTLSSFAQEPAAPKFSPMATDGQTVQYLYNVEAHAFMLGANDWNTRASVSVEKGYQFKIADNGNGTYTLNDYVENQSAWKAVFAGNPTDIWVDNLGGANVKGWVITSVGDNTYKITNPGAGAGELAVVQDLSDTRLNLRPSNPGAYAATWAFVNEADYAEYIAALDKDAVNAWAASKKDQVAEALKEEIKAANIVALDAMKAIIDGTNVAGEGFDAYVANYNDLMVKLEDGTLTETVVNPSAATGWHSSTAFNFLLTPWISNGKACNNFDNNLYINTWSVEGQSDGSNFLVPFFEYWTGDDASLAANTIKTTITGLVPGQTYQATAWTRVRIKNGATDPTGITFRVGNGEAVNVCAGDKFGAQFYIINAQAEGVADEEGNLEIAFEVAADNNISWLSFKDVYYSELSANVEISPAFIVEGEENPYTLNSHSAVSVPSATALKVNFGDNASVKFATYVINELVEDEFMGVVDVIEQEVASGTLSINTIGYAELETPATFYYGHKYNILIKAWDVADNWWEEAPVATFSCEFNGSTDELPALEMGEPNFGDRVISGEEINAADWNGLTISFPENNIAAALKGSEALEYGAIATVVSNATMTKAGDSEPCATEFRAQGEDYNSVTIFANTELEAGQGYTIVIPAGGISVINQMEYDDDWNPLVLWSNSEDIKFYVNTTPADDPIEIVGTKLELAPGGNSTLPVPDDAVRTYSFTSQWSNTVPNNGSFDASIYKDVTIEFGEALPFYYNTPYKDATGAQMWGGVAAGSTTFTLDIQATGSITDFNIQNTQASGTEGNQFSIVSAFANKLDGTSERLIFAAPGWGGSMSVSGVTSGLATFNGQWANIGINGINGVEGKKTLRIYSNTPLPETVQYCVVYADDNSDGWPQIGRVNDYYAETVIDRPLKSIVLQWTVAEPGSIDIAAITCELEEELELAVLPSLVLGEEEVAINDHSEASVDVINGLKVAFENGASVLGVSYAINAMKAVSDEEGTTWVVDESTDIAVGEMSMNTIAFVDFEDAIYFEQGNKYQIKITTYVNNGTDTPDEIVNYYIINGAYAPEIAVTPSLIDGDNEVALNDHSAVSVEAANAIKVQIDNAPEAIGVTYLINEMNQNEDEEGTFWTVGKELAAGEASMNTIAYAELETPLTFAFGKKYQLTVSVMGQPADEPQEIGTYTYEFNGATEIELASGDYVIKNVESGLYLNGANSWGTKASATKHGQFMTATKLEDGTYTIDSHISNGGDKHYLAAGDNTFVDALPANHTIEMVAPGIFTIKDANDMYLAAGEDGLVNFNAAEVTDAAKWQFITKEQLLVSLEDATAAEPGDATALIGDAGFGRNNQYISMWQGAPSKGGDNTNMCGEKYNCAFNVFQTLENMPNGLYTLKVQGFYRNGSSANAAATEGAYEPVAFFYANADSVEVPSIFMDAANIEGIPEDLNGYMDTDLGAIPNNMTRASQAFSQGLYGTEINFEVSDNTITLGVCKDTANEPDMNWTIFDNFELYYLGTGAVDPLEIEPAFVAGEEEITLNSHSNVSVESATALKVNVMNCPQAVGVTYMINEMVQGEDEEGTFWTVGKELAAGEASMNTIAYAEFENELVFEYGKKYQLSVSVFAQTAADPEEVGTFTYEFNGAWTAPELAVENELTPSVDALDGLAFVITGEDGQNTLTACHTTHPAGEQDAFSLNLNEYNGEQFIYSKFAKVTDSGVEGDNIYTIQMHNADAQNYALWGEQGYLNFQPTGQNIVFVLGLKGQYGQDAQNCALWRVTEVEGGYIIQNVGNGGYYDPNNAAPSAEPVVVKFWQNATADADSTIVTAINNIATSTTANGKYFQNGKVVIVRNGVKYNVNGAVIK